jgi:macrolide transport system ATP-binding/permease protein
MKSLRAWIMRLVAVFAREQREHELAAEMQSLLQLHIDENLRSGMSPDQARREAIAKLDYVEPVKQAYREHDRLLFLEYFMQDLHFSLRQLVKYPGFSITATLVLALGIGSSVAIFSFVDAALIKPLPYPDPDSLVHVTESIPLFPRANLSYLDYLDWKRMNKVFTSLDIYGNRGFMLSTPRGGELVSGGRVSDGFFRTLGVTPALGRDFYSGEDLPSAANTVILTYSTWQTRFGGRQDVIGKSINLSGDSFEIVGVLPAEFQFAPRGRVEFWTTIHPGKGCEARRSCHNFEGVARLKSGVSVESAFADTKLIAQQLEAQYPDSNRGQGASVVPLTEVIVGDIRPILFVLLSGAGLLLLIACVNVASLLLVRSESRKREITIRGALGASPSRLIRQFVTEGLVLVALAASVGLSFAHIAMKLLVGLISKDMMSGMPFLQGLGLNLHTVIFAAIISLLAALLFSITPLLRMPFGRMREGLADGARGSGGQWRRFGGRLVVIELATAMILLVAAGLLGKSFYRLLQVDIGFEPQNLATLQLMAPSGLYKTDEQLIALNRQVVDRVSALPGVKSAALTSVLPITSNGNTTWTRIVGQPYNGEHNEVMERYVSSGYFSTLQTKLLRGRFFTDAEDISKPKVVIINESFARQYFPNEDPIGKKIGDTDLSPKSIKEIIGVVENIKEGQLDKDTPGGTYVPLNQETSNFIAVVVRTSGEDEATLPSLINAIHEIAPNVGTTGETTMSNRIHDSQVAYLHRSSAWLVGGFALLAFVLGVVGLYGVIAYSVSQRTREIGVRVALGAQRVSIYKLVLADAGWLTGLGIVTGLIGSIAATAFLRRVLFGVSTWDLATLAVVSALLGVSAISASYIPARRAASVDPIEALRAE